MAKVKLSYLVSDIRGKIGGTVFQQSRGGLIIRNQPGKINRNSNRDTTSRNVLNSVVANFDRLSVSNQLVWTRFVEFSELKQKRTKDLFVSGRDAFIKFNYYRLRYAFPILTTPEFVKCVATPVTIDISTTGAVLTITTSRAMIPAEEFIILSLTNVYRSAVNNPGSAFKLIVFATTATNTFDVTAEYLAIFGITPQPGQRIFMQYTNASLQSGAPFPFKTITVDL
ncbi:MAG: hypothetical protein V3T88_08665 [Nitrosomonadaceae bacterium]